MRRGKMTADTTIQRSQDANYNMSHARVDLKIQINTEITGDTRPLPHLRRIYDIEDSNKLYTPNNTTNDDNTLGTIIFIKHKV